MANRVELPKNPELASKVLDAEHASKIADMGMIGTFFGSRDNAVIYIAAILVIAAIVASGVIAIVEPGLRADALKALAGLAALALGYMFGSGTRRSD